MSGSRKFNNSTTATALLQEDYVRTHIACPPTKNSASAGVKKRPDADYLPPSSESPFGSFPKEYTTKIYHLQKNLLLQI